MASTLTVDVPAFRAHLNEGVINTCKRELGESSQFSLQGLVGIKLPDDFMIVTPVAAAEELSFDIPIQTAPPERTEQLKNQLQVAVVTACAELISGETPTVILVEAMVSITVNAQIIFAYFKGTFEMYQMDSIENPGEKLVYAAIVKDSATSTSGDTDAAVKAKQPSTDATVPLLKIEDTQEESTDSTKHLAHTDDDTARSNPIKSEEAGTLRVNTEEFQGEYLKFSGKVPQPTFEVNKELLCIQPGTAEKIMAPVTVDASKQDGAETQSDDNSDDQEEHTTTVNVSISTIEPQSPQSADEGKESKEATRAPDKEKNEPTQKRRRGRPPKRLIESMDVTESPKKAEKESHKNEEKAFVSKSPKEVKQNVEARVIKLPSPSRMSTRRSKKEEEEKQEEEATEEEENKPPVKKRGRPKKKTTDEEIVAKDESNTESPQKSDKRQKVNIPTSRDGYMCEICGKSFRFKNSYYTHVKRHNSEEEHPCKTCGKVFALDHDLKKHMIQHTLSKSYICDICNKGFTNIYMLKRHEKTHQKGKKSFHCEHCPLKFFKQDDLDGHVQRVHANSEPVELRTCEICNRTFSTEKVLKVHMRTHEEMKYECHICHRKIRTEKALKGHLTMHTRTKPEVCEICGKRYTQKRGLQDHMRIHQGDLPHVCQYCGMKFRRPGLLRVHLYTHGNERNFRCEICPEKAFKSPAGLREHMKVHFGRKRLHKCRHCDKGFIGPSHLRKHEEYCQRRQDGRIDRKMELGDGEDYVILEMEDQAGAEEEGHTAGPTTIVAHLVDQEEAEQVTEQQQVALLEQVHQAGEEEATAEMVAKLEEGGDQAALMGKLVQAGGDQQIILLEQVVELEQVVGQLEAQGASNIIYLPKQ